MIHPSDAKTRWVEDPHLTATPSPTPMPTPKPRRRAWRILLVAVLLLGAAGASPFAARWIFYRHSHIVTHDAFVNGIVTNIGARIDGQVKTVVSNQNHAASKGDVLLRLEDSHLQAKVDQARAELERSTRELETERLTILQDQRLLEAGVEKASLEREIAAAELEAAKSDLDRVKRRLERITKLHEEGLEATSVLEDMTAQHAAATAARSAAQKRRESAQSSLQYARIELGSLPVRESRLGVKAAEVEKARASLAAATAEAEATVIRAPEDGWVVELLVGSGTSVRVGQPMLSFWAADQVWVEAWVDQAHLADVQVGSPVDVTLDAFDKSHLKGEVDGIWAGVQDELKRQNENSTLSPMLSKNSRIKVRIALRDVHAPLIPGLSAVVGIHKGARPVDRAG